MNIEEARRVVEEIYDGTADFEERLDHCVYLLEFLSELEYLLKHNSIKQTPALFKEKK